MRFIFSNTSTDGSSSGDVPLHSQSVTESRDSDVSSLWTTETVQLETLNSIVTEQTLGSIITEQTLGSVVTEHTLESLVTLKTIGSLVTEHTLGHIVTEKILETLATEHRTLGSMVTDDTLGHIVTEQTLGHIVTEQTLGHIVTEETFGHIVTDSLTEQVITVSLLMASWLYINFTNGFLLYVLKKMNTLDTPQYMLLVFYMICDVLYCNCQLLVMVPVAIMSSIDALNVVVCRVFITAATSFFTACTHLVGFIAYERYSYFVTPLKYPLKFTKVRIYTLVALIYLVSLSIAVAFDLVSPKVPVATTMSCQASGPYNKIAIIFQFTFFGIASGSISVITLIKLRLMMSKHQAQVAALPQTISDDQSAINGLIVKPIKKAFKMLALVSGSFWFTLMPGAVIRLSLSASGVTWLDTDYRTSIPLFAMSRASYIMITLVSSILNPIIYIAVLPDVRAAVLKNMGINK